MKLRYTKYNTQQQIIDERGDDAIATRPWPTIVYNEFNVELLVAHVGDAGGQHQQQEMDEEDGNANMVVL